jgi:hypothetical protein
MKNNNLKITDERFIYGDGDVLKNKKYLKDRAKLFKKHGNGWWFEYHTNKIKNRNRR